MEEGCWDAWFQGLADALRGRETPAQGRVLESADLVDPRVWPKIIAWLKTLPEGCDFDEDDPEPFI